MHLFPWCYQTIRVVLFICVFCVYRTPSSVSWSTLRNWSKSLSMKRYRKFCLRTYSSVLSVQISVKAFNPFKTSRVPSFTRTSLHHHYWINIIIILIHFRSSFWSRSRRCNQRAIKIAAWATPCYTRGECHAIKTSTSVSAGLRGFHIFCVVALHIHVEVRLLKNIAEE